MRLERRRGLGRASGSPGPSRGTADGAPPSWKGALARWRAFASTRAGRWLALVGFAVVGFAIGFAIAGAWLFPDRGGTEERDLVTVPDVREIELGEADRRLAALGLVVELRGRIAHPSVPEGWVVAQEPLGRQLAAAGAPVYLTVSRGRDVRTVPALEGVTAQHAESVLEALGFEVETRVVDAGGRRGVQGTDPPAGETVELPARIELQVAEISRTTVVPDLLGRHIDDVALLLEAAELELGAVSYVEDADQAPGRVIAQRPEPGAVRNVGEAVSLDVAGGAPERR